MSEENPWKTLSTRKVYENEWISVREDQVIRPDGSNGIYGVVTTRSAVATVALDDKGYVHLIGQYRYPTDEYSWEVVEGGDEDGETLLETAKRELREEAGLVAENWTQLGHEMHLSNCFSTEQAYVYLAEGLTEVDKDPDPTERLQVKKVRIEDAVKMALSGEIKDILSIVSIMLTSKHREERGV